MAHLLENTSADTVIRARSENDMSESIVRSKCIFGGNIIVSHKEMYCVTFGENNIIA